MVSASRTHLSINRGFFPEIRAVCATPAMTWRGLVRYMLAPSATDRDFSLSRDKQNYRPSFPGHRYNLRWFREERPSMPLIAPAAEWVTLSAQLKAETPEAFDSEGRILNSMEGEGKEPGFGRHYESPIDGRSLGGSPMIDREAARSA